MVAQSCHPSIQEAKTGSAYAKPAWATVRNVFLKRNRENQENNLADYSFPHQPVNSLGHWHRASCSQPMPIVAVTLHMGLVCWVQGRHPVQTHDRLQNIFPSHSKLPFVTTSEGITNHPPTSHKSQSYSRAWSIFTIPQLETPGRQIWLQNDEQG